MTFIPNIPQSGQTLGQTQATINNNFANYNTVMSVNHVAPNASGQGKHTFAEFIVQASAPATAANEVATYSRVANSVPQLFLQKQNQLSGASDTQLSRLDFGISANQTGYSFLPGGIILQWGIGTATSAGTTINFPKAFTSNCWGVTIGITGYGGSSPHLVSANSITTSSFVARTESGTNLSTFWFSVGN